jgi:hypothetical protein
MLSLLVDEQISDVVAAQIRVRRPACRAESVHKWRQGALAGADDDSLLRAAAQDGLTLVTYDQRTIQPLLHEWGSSGISHAGGIFVDDRTIAPQDFGRLINALVQLWDRERDADWRDRIVFLPST